ncbi:DUF934 domain-containing protein [Amphritea sp. HPY]|uniref:DUF934 domain-containing protein n=1 Tax=Amphritea sp. HPY TaxID=3421652 RepID=UPI003D7E56EE
MQQIIKENRIIHNSWTLIEENQTTEFSPTVGEFYILPISIWLQQAPTFIDFIGVPGIRISGNEELESIAEIIRLTPLIAVEFTAFTDGSGFSTASILRQTYGYEGEIRAFGSLLPDQAPYLFRCGFNALALPQEHDLEAALILLEDSDTSYQGSALEPRTPFHLRLVK